MAKKYNVENTKKLVKVDMTSTWAKEELIPALEHLRQSGEAWTMIKAPLSSSMSLRGREDTNIRSATSSATLTIRELKLSPSTLRMAILNVGTVNIQSRGWKSWDIRPHGLGSLIILAPKKRLDSSVSSLRG